VSVPLANVQTRPPASMTVVKPPGSLVAPPASAPLVPNASALQTLQNRSDRGQFQVVRNSSASPDPTAASPAEPPSFARATELRSADQG